MCRLYMVTISPVSQITALRWKNSAPSGSLRGRPCLPVASHGDNLWSGRARPLDVLHANFTELRFAEGTQKANLMPIIGHVGKLAFSWAVDESAKLERPCDSSVPIQPER